MAELKVLAIGDVVGSPGRNAVAQLLPKLVREEGLGFVVCNAENAAGGTGLTPAIVKELLAAGCSCITTGDHVYKNKEVMAVIDAEPRLLRPANISRHAAGRGWGVYETVVPGSRFPFDRLRAPSEVEGPVPGSQTTTLNPEPGTLNQTAVKVAVINLLGRSFMGGPSDNPYDYAGEALAAAEAAGARVVLVDMHAEATAEKIAMGRFLDGRASAVWGTHTHVQTADETVLAAGTGYITDIGMTGGLDGVIGREAGPVIEHLRLNMPTKWQIADRDVRLSGAIFTMETSSGRCRDVRRVQVKMG
jgi:calcineurin-like phosphoesterase